MLFLRYYNIQTVTKSDGNKLSIFACYHSVNISHTLTHIS